MKDFPYKTEPFPHQKDIFEKSWDRESYGLLLEMGTGKTKVTIDTAAALYLDGKIDGMLVLAPNGVHQNWVSNELPRHLPDVVAEKSFTYCYHSNKARTVQSKTSMAQMVATVEPGDFRILCMSYSGFMTKDGGAWLKKFFKRTDGRFLYVLDESARIKGAKTKRTKAIIRSSVEANYRRILTGTPVTNSPFDIYTQMAFLDMGYWKRNGVRNYTTFKAEFGIFEQSRNMRGQLFNKVVGYRKLDKLKMLVDPMTVRVTKDQVLDLPPKLYTTVYTDMTAEQRRLYAELVDSYLAVTDEGEVIDAALAIVRLLRLQQIVCGYVTTDEGKIRHLGPDVRKNPRLTTLMDILEDVPGQAIIWARFKEDINQITALLGEDAVRYDGQVTDGEKRQQAVDRFQAGEVKFFVGNPAAAGEGLTLHAATTVIYYSNSFKLADRLQSEDRAHRIGQEKPVTYIDIVAPGTVDEHIVRSLVQKLDVASAVVGDGFREWIRQTKDD